MPTASTTTRRTFALAAGLVAGLIPKTVRAGGGSRSGPSASVAGPIKIEQGIAMGFGQGKIQAPMDAIYWLDYAGARLYAAIPAARQTPQDVALLREFAERDLVADFALRPGDEPRFLMQTASLGGMGGGSSVLLVIETATRQVAAYQAKPRANMLDPRPEFERLQPLPVRPGGSPPRPKPPGMAAMPRADRRGRAAHHPAGERRRAVAAGRRLLARRRHAPPGTPRLHAALPSLRQTGDGGPGAQWRRRARPRRRLSKLWPGVAPRLLLNCASSGAPRCRAASALLLRDGDDHEAGRCLYPRRAWRRRQRGTPRRRSSLTQIKSYLDEAPPPLPTRANPN